MARFVGREAEMSRIRDVVQRSAHAAQPVVVLVYGEPGSGKTRLLSEAASAASVDIRFDVSGYQQEHHVPLGAVGPMLRAMATGSSALTFDPRQPVPALQVFEAAYRALAAAGSMLLLVDDVQWVDETSLALCHYLIRGAEAEGLPFVVLAGGRSAPATQLFAASVARVVPPERQTIFELPPLVLDESIELVREVNPSLEGEAAADVARRSLGSPFWVETLARSGDPVRDVSAVVAARMYGTTPDASSVLALLVVMGRPLLADEIAEIQGWQAERVQAAESELVRRGVALSHQGLLRVVHDLFSSAAEQEVPDAQRARLHRRIAAWLEGHAGEDPSLLLDALGHRRAAGLPIVGVARRVAASPRSRGLGPEVIDLIGRVADDADPDDPEGMALAQEVALLASDLGRYDLALERWQRVAQYQRDPAMRAKALFSAAEAAFFAQRPDEARTFLARCRELEEATNELIGTACDTIEASILRWSSRQFVEADRLTERSLAVLRTRCTRRGGAARMPPEERRHYLRAIQAARDSARMRSDHELDLSLADELIAAAGDLDVLESVTAAVSAASTSLVLGRLDEAESRLRKALVEAHRRVLPRLAVEAGYWLTRTLYFRGDLREAQAVAEDCLALTARTGERSRIRMEAEAFLHVVRVSAGDWAAAVQALRDLAADEKDGHYRIGLHLELAAGLSRSGDASFDTEVEERLAAARAEADAAGCQRCRDDVLLRGADALARIRQPTQAREWLLEWDQDHGGQRRPWRHLRATGTLAAMDGTEDAVQLLRILHDKLASRGLGLEELWATLDLAMVLVASDRTEAIKVLKEAVERADGLGAANEMRLAEQRLRKLGVRTWRRGPAQAGLTNREREIARLIIAGASNPEIASATFLSRKTVERHVTNILSKMGARNRTELAGRLAEHPSGLVNEGPPR